jgi:hypothetical protein
MIVKWIKIYVFQDLIAKMKLPAASLCAGFPLRYDKLQGIPVKANKKSTLCRIRFLLNSIKYKPVILEPYR